MGPSMPPRHHLPVNSFPMFQYFKSLQRFSLFHIFLILRRLWGHLFPSQPHPLSAFKYFDLLQLFSTSKMRQICHSRMHKCWPWTKCQWELDTCGHFVFLVIWMSSNIWPQRCRRVHCFYFRIQAEFPVWVEWCFPKLPSVTGEVQVPFMKDNVPWPAAFPWSIPELKPVFLIHRHLQNTSKIWKHSQIYLNEPGGLWSFLAKVNVRPVPTSIIVLQDFTSVEF